MSDSRENKLFTNRHTWVVTDEASSLATVGITDYLTENLDSVLSIDMPMEGDELDIDTFCIHLHMEKRIHHLRSPLTGRVVEINKDVLDTPSLLHLDPYANWLYKMEYDDPDELDMLKDAKAYAHFIDQL